MFESLVDRILQSQGVWAAFAVALVCYVMTASARREARLLHDAARREGALMRVLTTLSDRFGTLAGACDTLRVELTDIKRDLQHLLHTVLGHR